MDLSLFHALNRMSSALEPELRFFSEATNYLWFKGLLAAMVIGMVWRGGKARAAATQALIAFPIANGLTDLLKHGLPEARPCNALYDWAFHGIGCSDSMGTASAHSANMAAVAFVFCYRMGWWGVPWAIIALLTGVSRVYVGAHYPHQVALGWICGICVAGIICATWDLIQKKRRPVLPSNEPADPH